MTKSDAQRFTELTGGCWHSVVARGLENICSCGFKSYLIVSLDEHIEESHPTYSAVDILKRMKEFCGEEKYRKFIRTKAIGLCQLTDDEWIISIYETYILNPALLLRKCIEFLEGEK